MSKKIIASIVVSLMVLSIFSVLSTTAVPQAHAQGDELTTVFLQPGVPDPNNPGFSLTLGTLRNNPNLVAQTQNNFAVLQGSTGDLMFTFTVNAPIGYIRIYLPPDFKWTTPPSPSAGKKYSIWTDITNDYGYIAVSHRGVFDSVAPNWYRITIGRHDATFGGGFNTAPSPMYAKFVIEPGVYHVRILGLTAPDTVGVYHFKIATDSGFIPVADFPIIIVKGELNPAYMTGLVEADGDMSGLSGMVTATGTTAGGRPITGIDMLSPEDECPLLADQCGGAGAGFYRYYIFGLPAGTYNVNSTMSGQTADSTERFTVAAGQSYHRTNNLGPSKGPTVSVHVFSKHGRGTIPWNCLWQPPFGTNDPTMCDDQHPRDITVVLNDTNGNQIGFWGSDYYGVWTGLPNEQKAPTDPTASDYTMQLTDTRGLPSINWMAVPSDHADYVAGFSSGTDYKVGAYVTGYVMTADDAFQRTFTIGTGTTGTGTAVEMDLRRSNWFQITAHELNNLYATTLVVAAVPTGTGWPVSAGTESGLAAVTVPPASDRGTNDFTVIMEGWAEGWPGALPTWDYGLAPGTYDIHMMAADEGLPNAQGVITQVGHGIYYIRGGEPFIGSIALCNSPSTLSFRVRSFTLDLALRSVDSEIPAHTRPWLFPGAEIWVNFLTNGAVAASIDPTEYSWTYGLVQDNGLVNSPWDADTVNAPGMHSLLQMTWAGFNPTAEDVVTGNSGYPTSLSPGEYNFQVHTYGYTTARVFPVSVPDGGSGDIQMDLIQGGMVRVNLDFKQQKEKVPFNGFVRVEIYNSSNQLVGANIYGMAQPNVCDTPTGCTGDTPSGVTVSSSGNYPDYSAANDFKVVTGPAEGSNIDPYGQRGYLSSVWYGSPSSTWAGWPVMDPSDANRLKYDTTASASFDLYGFYWYYGGPSSRNDGYWANGWETTDGTHQPDTGILASRDTPLFKGGGLYTVKVFAFDPYGPDGTFGTADDWQSYYADAVTNVEVPWGGGTTIAITMNQMGRISGTATWLDMYGDMASVPWATITAGPTFASTTSPIDLSWGFGYGEPAYYMWLPAGTQDVSIVASNAPQVFGGASSTVVVSDGWNGSYDQTLIPTGVPVPEFPASMLLVMLSALGASVYLLRRKRTTN